MRNAKGKSSSGKVETRLIVTISLWLAYAVSESDSQMRSAVYQRRLVESSIRTERKMLRCWRTVQSNISTLISSSIVTSSLFQWEVLPVEQSSGRASTLNYATGFRQTPLGAFRPSRCITRRLGCMSPRRCSTFGRTGIVSENIFGACFLCHMIHIPNLIIER